MNLQDKKQKLVNAELDIEQERVRRLREDHRRRWKYGPPAPSASTNRRSYSSAACLRGEAGSELQCLVRDLLTARRIGYNDEAAAEYRRLVGKDLL
jgi:hypothetical protein